jgi:hypothetical protein
MVLFGKNALTKAYLLSNRAFSRTSSNNFNYFLKEVQKPFKTEVAAVHNKCECTFLTYSLVSKLFVYI